MSFSADKLKSIAFSPAYRGFALGNKYDVIITPNIRKFLNFNFTL